MKLPKGYLPIGEHYGFACLKIGVIVMRLEDQQEAYFQPGDCEADILKEIKALLELDAKLIDNIANMTLGEYF